MPKHETYEQIVERRMNERAKGIQMSIELHARQRGIKRGETIQRHTERQTPERKPDKTDNREKGNQ